MRPQNACDCTNGGNLRRAWGTPWESGAIVAERVRAVAILLDVMFCIVDPKCVREGLNFRAARKPIRSLACQGIKASSAIA